MRIVIIGGGIGGLTAALALQHGGHDVTVCERAPQLREVGAGLTLWANAVHVLRQLGCAESLAAVSTVLDRSEIRTTHGKLLAVTSLAELGQRWGAPTVGIHRADLQTLLHQALTPGTVRLGMDLSGFEPDSEGVTAHFTNGATRRGDVLIGADGLHSRVRSQLHGYRPARYAGYTAWPGVARCECSGHSLGQTQMFIGQGKQFGVLPIGPGRTYWFGTRNQPAALPNAPQGNKADATATFAGWHADVTNVIAATDEQAVIRNDILDRVPMRRWGEGRVTLLGDAAHPTTPNLGQGACQAIEDAPVLADCLARHADVTDALRQYERLRWDRTTMITRTSWKLGRMFTVENPVLGWLRDRALAWTPARINARQLDAIVGLASNASASV